jgi:hypothetical protein
MPEAPVIVDVGLAEDCCVRATPRDEVRAAGGEVR